VASSEHPRVFVTADMLAGLAHRIGRAGSFSAESFARLTDRVATDLAGRTDWDAVYSGCDLDLYLHAFSYESPGGYGSEQRSAAEMRAAIGAKPDLAPPAGAAIVAARDALYAVLIAQGAPRRAGAPRGGDAAALAKRILVAWSTRGFRGTDGRFIRAPTQFCDGRGRFDPLFENGVGLQIARGVVYSVHAQDLLESLGALDAQEATVLDAFHSAMFDLIGEASRFRFALPGLNRPDQLCELYSNHVASHLVGMLAVARLLDDRRRFEAVLGGDSVISVPIPWTAYFDHAIYGTGDTPIACMPNSGPDALTSHPAYQSPIVAPGEIEDRYRNANPLQGIGYPAGVLSWLFASAELMRNAGFDAYGYTGRHGQSIEMATTYYACLARGAGFGQTVTAENARDCPDFGQYLGKVVKPLEIPIMIGALRFPGDTVITRLDAAAKTAVLGGTGFGYDPLLFGRWTD
jgi:hypothetical protein